MNQSFIAYFGFSAVANYYFQVFFNLKVTLCLAKILQDTLTEHLTAHAFGADA